VKKWGYKTIIDKYCDENKWPSIKGKRNKERMWNKIATSEKNEKGLKGRTMKKGFQRKRLQLQRMNDNRE